MVSSNRISRTVLKGRFPEILMIAPEMESRELELLTTTPGDSDTSGLWPQSLETMLFWTLRIQEFRINSRVATVLIIFQIWENYFS